MPEQTRITLTPPSGRAMFAWEGKHPLSSVAAPPVRLTETFGIPFAQREQITGDGALECLSLRETAPAGLLLHGDNKDALARLLADGWRGAVKLVYIDPPFDSGASYARRVRLRGPGGAHALNTRRHKAGRQPQYADVWGDDSYLQFMYERLILLRELLAEDGSLWLHCDHRRAHHLRLMLDEVFGAENYLNTVSWRSQTARGAKVNAFFLPFSTHYLEIYGKNRARPTTWNQVRRHIVLTEAEAECDFMRDERGFFRTSDPGAYSFESLKTLRDEGRLYAPYAGQVVVDEVERRVFASNGGNIGVKYYLKDLGRGRYAVERAVDNLWDDVPGLGTTPGEDLGYPTQKTEALLRRIIAASTHPGDLVLDGFVGSGTAIAVAHKLGRRWIGCDSNPGAIQTSARRMQMIGRRTTDNRQQMTDAFPSASSYAIYRVGDHAPAGQPIDHPPAQARVAFERAAAHGRDELRIRIDGYDSPAVAERLADGAGHAPRIEDWRSMVDSVAIDPAYDGRVLRVSLADAPARKADLVAGSYALDTPSGETTAAVRIIDVLGEETLIVQRV